MAIVNECLDCGALWGVAEAERNGPTCPVCHSERITSEEDLSDD